MLVKWVCENSAVEVPSACGSSGGLQDTCAGLCGAGGMFRKLLRSLLLEPAAQRFSAGKGLGGVGGCL